MIPFVLIHGGLAAVTHASSVRRAGSIPAGGPKFQALIQRQVTTERCIILEVYVMAEN